LKRASSKRATLTRAAFSALAILGAVMLAACPVQGAQRMIIGTQLEPPVLDPTANPAAAISEVLYGNVYEGLVQFAADGSVLPKLALSWEISSDGLTYLFHLKSGVRFHDGSEFDAAAAKYSVERIVAPGSTASEFKPSISIRLPAATQSPFSWT